MDTGDLHNLIYVHVYKKFTPFIMWRQVLLKEKILVLNTCTYNVSLFDILPLVHISNKWFRNHDACLRVQSNFEWTTNVLLEYGMPKNVQI